MRAPTPSSRGPGVTLTTAWGDHMMLSFVQFERADALIPEHQHPHEQMGVGLEGEFELIIDGESRERFMQEVGFLLPEKNAKYAAWVGDKKLLKSQRFTSRISAIEPAGEEAVYDTTQPDHNSVVFNGLVTGQCGEQPLPPYGCCDLGPVVLTKFVRHPFGFGGAPAFDFEAFAKAVATQVRALDNVLDLTFWPLEQQKREAMAKRRIGVGFTGLGNALAMLRLRYDAPEGRDMAARIARCMRDTASSSVPPQAVTFTSRLSKFASPIFLNAILKSSISPSSIESFIEK